MVPLEQRIAHLFLDLHAYQEKLANFTSELYETHCLGRSSELVHSIDLVRDNGSVGVSLRHSFRFLESDYDEDLSELEIVVELRFLEENCLVKSVIHAALQCPMGEFSKGFHLLDFMAEEVENLEKAMVIFKDKVRGICEMSDLMPRLGL
ncbi:hypothetical protein [Embleya sp. NPDC059237]|uniref:hypothetical protein n=1 Tax=Embleya sp. NPDC059237 TaxID=3346784 RepID=UPI0036ADA18F